MKGLIGNSSPPVTRRLAGTAVALLLLGSGCSENPSTNNLSNTKAETPINLPAHNKTVETSGLNKEVRTTVKCLASKILDVALTNQAGGANVNIVGTQAIVSVQIPEKIISNSGQALVDLSAEMGVTSNGEADPSSATGITVESIYPAADSTSVNSSNLYSWAQIDNAAGWRLFTQQRGQEMLSIYSTKNGDELNPKVQLLSIAVLQAATAGANGIIGIATNSALPVCI